MKPIDTNFYIDRMFGFPIVIPVVGGIVQEFYDQEYHGHLSGKTVGKHINELRKICKTKLHKSWVKHWAVASTYDKTKYSNLEYHISLMKKEIEKFDKSIVVRSEIPGYHSYYPEPIASFNNRQKQLNLSKTEAVNLLAELEGKFVAAQEEIRLAKLKVFQEHGIEM